MTKWIMSESLGLEYRTRRTRLGTRLQTKDKIVYNENEVFLLRKNNMKLKKDVHNVKKILNGEIVRIGR